VERLKSPEYAVDISGLEVVIGKSGILSGIDLRIKKGEAVAIIGPNGAGKTTLIKTIMGLLKPASGHLEVNAEKIAYAPEEAYPYPEMKVSYFLGWIASLKNTDPKTVSEFVKKFELEKHLHKKFKELSKGLRRRVLLVQALSGSETLVVLDEPSSGLDIEFKLKLRDILGELKRKNPAKTFIICSHETVVLEKIADRVIVLNRGKIIFDRPADDVKRLYGGLYIEKLYEDLVRESPALIEKIYKRYNENQNDN